MLTKSDEIATRFPAYRHRYRCTAQLLVDMDPVKHRKSISRGRWVVGIALIFIAALLAIYALVLVIVEGASSALQPAILAVSGIASGLFFLSGRDLPSSD